jgi:hypothetical protein
LELDQFPDRITLTPGKGLNFLPLGVTEDRVLRVAGIPIRVSTTGKNRYLYYDPGLVLMFRNSGALSVIYARDEFAGKTDKGILLGDDKQAVVQAYGEPVQQADDFQRFDGLRVEYDDKGKVKTLSVFPKKKKKEPGREHPASMAME